MRAAAERGRLLHSLFERLPGVPAPDRARLADGWLERSAGQFKQIDPSKTEPQALVDETFPTYNFDVIDGVEDSGIMLN